MTYDPTLGRDERGAIMVLALFFVIFGVALLYSVIGTAEASLFREHVQDAADSVALSSAVMLARSMNFIVLLNILMAAFLAILVTIKLIQGLAIIGIGIALGLAWLFGASLAAIPPLNTLQTEMENLYGTLKPPIFKALEILHTAADTVKTAGPFAARAAAADDVNQWKPPADNGVIQNGVVVAASDELPVEDSTFDKLCGEAGKLPVEIAKEELKVLPDFIMNPLRDLMGAMTEALSEWFCGSDGEAPKPFTYSTDPVYPVQAGDCAKTAATAECAKAQALENQSKPDPQTGECQAGADCSLGGPYDQRAIEARAECDPSKPNPPEEYFYQTRHATVPYTWTGASWLRGTPEFEDPKFVDSSAAPCGSAGSIGTGYNTVVRTSSDVTDVAPVCSSDKAPRSIDSRPGDVVTVDYVEVRQIFACKRHEEKQVNLDVSGGQGGTEASSSKTPKQLLTGAALGDEHFQVRSVMWGDTSLLVADGAVSLALWGKKPMDPFSGLRDLDGHAVAQAEYFYDGSDGKDAWMWNMKWRARLRRFRVADDSMKRIREACDSTCGTFLDHVSQLSDLIAH